MPYSHPKNELTRLWLFVPSHRVFLHCFKYFHVIKKIPILHMVAICDFRGAVTASAAQRQLRSLSMTTRIRREVSLPMLKMHPSLFHISLIALTLLLIPANSQPTMNTTTTKFTDDICEIYFGNAAPVPSCDLSIYQWPALVGFTSKTDHGCKLPQLP